VNPYTLHALAKHLLEPIDAHVELIGSSEYTVDEYYQREAASVAARSRAAYLIQHLADAAAAARLARLLGMPQQRGAA
jgi:outer membrane protein assembly factor BamD (BamD/ComL family)